MKKGDHIYVDLGSCKQHGIYIDKSLVIYWTDQDSKTGKVRQASLTEFTQGEEAKVREYSCRCIERDKTVEKAERRLKENELKYQFLNSKDFAIYCRTGLKMGDHIYTDYDHSFHHGIYCGNEEVIHYINGSKICKTPLSKFSKKQRIRIKYYHKHYSQARVVKRAEQRLGERKYNLIFNNCEHFASWCKTGKSRCQQGEQALSTGAKAVVYGARQAGKEAEKVRRATIRNTSRTGKHIVKKTAKIFGIRLR